MTSIWAACFSSGVIVPDLCLVAAVGPGLLLLCDGRKARHLLGSVLLPADRGGHGGGIADARLLRERRLQLLEAAAAAELHRFGHQSSERWGLRDRGHRHVRILSRRGRRPSACSAVCATSPPP